MGAINLNGEVYYFGWQDINVSGFLWVEFYKPICFLFFYC